FPGKHVKKMPPTSARAAVLKFDREDSHRPRLDAPRSSAAVEHQSLVPLQDDLAPFFALVQGQEHETSSRALSSAESSRAYSPPSLRSCSCAPRCTTLPSRNTMISSQSRIVLSR